MISETKAASATHLHHHESVSSPIRMKFISSINSDHIRKYRSGNNISTKEKFHHYSPDSSIRSIDETDQKFPNKDLIHTYFPVANIQQDSTMIRRTSSRSPTVPKQAGTFLHRLVNKFLSITNINHKKTNRTRIRRKPKNTILSDDSHTFVNITAKKGKRQRLKTTTRKNQQCHVCRKYRNCFSILPTDSLECSSQSPMIFNTNAITTTKNPSVLTHKPSISLPKIHFEKLRPLNQPQCQTVASAIQLIFDTLLSNYQQDIF